MGRGARAHTEFQLIDLDEAPAGTAGQPASVPVLRLFGVTDDGASVVLFVPGFRPYFYFPVTAAFTDADAETCAAGLRRDVRDLAFCEAWPPQRPRRLTLAQACTAN